MKTAPYNDVHENIFKFLFAFFANKADFGFDNKVSIKSLYESILRFFMKSVKLDDKAIESV